VGLSTTFLKGNACTHSDNHYGTIRVFLPEGTPGNTQAKNTGIFNLAGVTELKKCNKKTIFYRYLPISVITVMPG
jgi:hypothetical protein